MKYEFLGVFGEGQPMSGTLSVGHKNEWINLNITELRLPMGVELEVKSMKDGSSTQDNLAVLLTSKNVKEAGTFGFAVSSPNTDVEPITYVFGVKGEK